MASITGGQVRMARAFLRWSIAELAARAGVGESTVKVIEAADNYPGIAGGLAATLEHRTAERAACVDAIARACVAAGITFLPDDGKRGAGVRGQIGGPPPRKSRSAR